MAGNAGRPRRVSTTVLRTWWVAVRPYSFTASATPVLVGSALALRAGRFSPWLFAVTLIASVAIHAGTNLLNDYYDHVRGVDTAESVGPSGVIQRGLLAPRAVLAGGFAALGAGSLLGLGLAAVAGWPILAVGALSVLAGYAYTGGPLPLGYVGLGDAVVFVFMGPVMVLATYYVQARSAPAAGLWASIPVAALVTAILVVNNLRDLADDRARGKRTLATAIGPAATRLEYAALIVTAYAAVGAGVLVRALPPLSLLALLTLPLAARTWRAVREDTDPRVLTRRALRGTALLHQRVGLLIALALLPLWP